MDLHRAAGEHWGRPLARGGACGLCTEGGGVSSKRRIRRKSCAGKVRHDDAATARKALFLTVQGDRVHQPMNVYRCKFCKGYHIGHRGGKG